MNQLEIICLGESAYEVWDYWGQRVFEAQTEEECEDYIQAHSTREQETNVTVCLVGDNCHSVKSVRYTE